MRGRGGRTVRRGGRLNRLTHVYSLEKCRETRTQRQLCSGTFIAGMHCVNQKSVELEPSAVKEFAGCFVEKGAGGGEEGGGCVTVAVIVPHFHMKKSSPDMVDGVEARHEEGRSRGRERVLAEGARLLGGRGV